MGAKGQSERHGANGEGNKKRPKAEEGARKKERKEKRNVQEGKKRT